MRHFAGDLATQRGKQALGLARARKRLGSRHLKERRHHIDRADGRRSD